MPGYSVFCCSIFTCLYRLLIFEFVTLCNQVREFALKKDYYKSGTDAPALSTYQVRSSSLDGRVKSLYLSCIIHTYLGVTTDHRTQALAGWLQDGTKKREQAAIDALVASISTTEAQGTEPTSFTITLTGR